MNPWYDDLAVEAMARGRYPNNDAMARKLMMAIQWLRTQSKKGWAMDKVVISTPARSLLHGYVAVMPPVQTHVSLSDEVILGPWSSKKG